MDAAIFGLIVADLLAEPMDLRRPPAPGGLALINSIKLTSGGNVPNTAIAMSKLGMKVAAAGIVGNDVLGAALIDRLNANGVDTAIALDTVNPPAGRELLDPILPHLDIFAPSRTEGAALTGESDPRKMVANFRRQMPGGLIGIKLDAEGCLFDDGSKQLTAPAYKIK